MFLFCSWGLRDPSHVVGEFHHPYDARGAGMSFVQLLLSCGPILAFAGLKGLAGMFVNRSQLLDD
jgi:hypothetical protein